MARVAGVVESHVRAAVTASSWASVGSSRWMLRSVSASCAAHASGLTLASASGAAGGASRAPCPGPAGERAGLLARGVEMS